MEGVLGSSPRQDRLFAISTWDIFYNCFLLLFMCKRLGLPRERRPMHEVTVLCPWWASASKDISAEPGTLADRDEADGSPLPLHPRKRARFDADPARVIRPWRLFKCSDIPHS